MMRNRLPGPGALTAIVLLAATPLAHAEGWGNVKGQVVWAGGDVPVREKLNVDKDPDACQKDGPLLSEKYVVDPKTKGVRWALVWLVNPKGALPIKPELQAIKEKTIVLDQPTCQFQPHVLAIREGQVLDVKNSAKIAHNVNVAGGALNPNLNQLVGAGADLVIKDFKAATIPVTVSCNIHGWMKSYIKVLDHPYFAVTDAAGNFEIKDAPAGTWNLVVWQEEKGWVTENRKNGVPITIPASGTVNLGKIELKP